MTTREDPREALMWEKELLVTSEELKSYAANYPPMGVYIPRGRVKVPRLKSRRITQISQSARGKRNSPNLLMIRPPTQASNRLPSISVYATRNVNTCDVMRDTKPHHAPSTSSRYVIEHRGNDSKPTKSKTRELDSMMSQFMYPTNDVINNKISEYAKTLAPTPVHPLLPQVLPPPYVEADKGRHYAHGNVTSQKDMTSIMTQDVPFPLGHHYYQHLSAIAAMAWSDCNQATEKLRRIYEETAHLSRTYDPFGFLSGGIPGYHPQILSSSPALGNTASIFGSNDPAVPHADFLTARYQQLAEDHNKYMNQAMIQRKPHCAPSSSTKSQFTNYGVKQENCDVTYHKERTFMTSQNNPKYISNKEPLPGIALFDSQYKQSMTQARQHLPYDVTMRNSTSRQKRKACDQGLFDDQSLAKITRHELRSSAAQQNHMPRPDNPSMTSQSYKNMTSFLQEGFMPGSNSRPPPYESIVPNMNPFGQEMLKNSASMKNDYQTIKNNYSDVNNVEKHNVINTSFVENLNFCLPSVSFSPTQPHVNDMQRNVPFVLQ